MSVYKRYNGTRINSEDTNWDKGTWYIYKRISGRRPIQKAIPEAKTEKQAQKAELAEIAKAFNKKYGDAEQNTTFHEFADTTYRNYIEQKNVNKKAKLTDLEVFLKFFGKEKLLVEIKVKDCRDLQYRLINTPTYRDGIRSPSTVNRTMSSLSKIFTLACEEEILKRNPMQHVAALDEPPPRQRRLTSEQKEAFWKEVVKDKFMFRIVMLGLNMPVRRGQILALKKADIDIESRKAFVISSKRQKPRSVPLNNAALHILSEMCSEVEAGHLITYKGKPIHDFRTRWEKLLIRAKINKKDGTREENFHFHDLRTELASTLVRNNVNPEIIRQLYDHSSMQITQGYIDTEEEMLYDAVNSLPDNTPSGEIINSEVIQ
jgi:integrase